jgi:hypothetical protein
MNPVQSFQVDTAPDIKITRWNFRRLDSLLASHADEWSWRAAGYLARELTRSTVVDEVDIPANTVTMRSRVEFHAEGVGVRQVRHRSGSASASTTARPWSAISAMRTGSNTRCWATR